MFILHLVVCFVVNVRHAILRSIAGTSEEGVLVDHHVRVHGCHDAALFVLVWVVMCSGESGREEGDGGHPRFRHSCFCMIELVPCILWTVSCTPLPADERSAVFWSSGKCHYFENADDSEEIRPTQEVTEGRRRRPGVPLGRKGNQTQQYALLSNSHPLDCTFYDEVKHGEDHFVVGDTLELLSSGKQPSLEGDYKVKRWRIR